MKIKHSWRTGTVDISLASAVENRISGGPHDRGAVEEALDISRQAAAEFGKLIEMLHSKNVLSNEDVKKFIGYGYEIEE